MPSMSFENRVTLHRFRSFGHSNEVTKGDEKSTAKVMTLMVATVLLTAFSCPAHADSYNTQVLVKTGMTAPGGGVFTTIAGCAMNNRHDVAFYAKATGGIGNREGVFLRDGITGQVRAVATTLDTVPGTINTKFSSISSVFEINNSGVVTFGGQIAIGGDPNGQFTGDGSAGSLKTIATRFTPVSGGGQIGSIYGLPSISDSGTVTFNSLSSGTSGLYYSPDGNPSTALQKVVETGDVVSGIGTVRAVGVGIMDDLGTGIATFTTEDSPIDYSLVRFHSGIGFSRLAMAGTPVAEGGALSRSISGFLGLNANNDVLFNANIEVSGSGSVGAIAVVKGADGAVHKIARGGDAAPNGGVFNGYFQGAPSLNTSGNVAFIGSVDGGNISSNGIFISKHGTLSQILPITALIDGFSLSNVYTGRKSLDDSNNLSFYYETTDGTQGIALSTFHATTAVPESGTATLVVVAMGLVVILSGIKHATLQRLV